MKPWQNWKNNFSRWEESTANYVDRMLRNPSLIGPVATILSGAMKGKTATEAWIAMPCSLVGIPSKRDIERAAHKINQLQSRILDLEEEIEFTLSAHRKD